MSLFVGDIEVSVRGFRFETNVRGGFTASVSTALSWRAAHKYERRFFRRA